MDTELTRRRMLLMSALTVATFVPLGRLIAGEMPIASKGIDAGELSGYAREAIYPEFHDQGFYLIHHDNRLIAQAAVCTHKHGDLVPRADGFVCRRHGSIFTVDGKVTKGPAREDLPRFAISVDDRKHVMVDTTQVFKPGQFDGRGAYVEFPTPTT